MCGMTSTPRPTAGQIRQINDTIRYAMWSVFRVSTPIPRDHAHRDRLVRDVTAQFADDSDVVTRGVYDVAGMSADADVMIWWHAEKMEELQSAYHRMRRSEFGGHLTPVWSAAALHRPAEFNKGHIPAFMAGEEPKRFICVYPFVRSYEWYLLPETERRDMLVEHGRMARHYPDVRANTIASFALGDYEWVLAFEADELHRIVDLMRDLRGSQARRHVREETPFFTGRRVSIEELVAQLP